MNRFKLSVTIRRDLVDELVEEAKAVNMSVSRHLENILLARSERSKEAVKP